MNVFETLIGSPLLIVRLIAAVGGFVVGYVGTGPLWRAFWRIARRQPIPSGLLPWMKFCTGIVLAALLYTLVGFGGTGWGWGRGGGGTGTTGGTGVQKGTGKGDGSASGEPKKQPDPPIGKNRDREILYVELLGGERYLGDGKYYLLNRKPPAVGLADIDAALKARPNKIELHILYLSDSVGQRSGPADRLRDLVGKYQIPLVETVEGDK